jgi:hypothetical protein
MKASFESKEEIIQEIQAKLNLIKSGQISENEINELVSYTQELHERVLILRYKMYEEKILGKKQVINDNFSHAENLEIEKIAETLQEEIDIPEIKIEEESSKIEEIVDFAIQEESKEKIEHEPMLSFDLFAEKPLETPAEKEIIQTETISENETISSPEPILYEEPKTIESTFEPKPVTAFEQKMEAPFNDIFKGLYLSDQADMPSFLRTKISVLAGSFGLNEKLQFIAELFNHSSENFNEAVHILDNLSSFDDAKHVMINFSNEYNWDLESKAVAEFIQKVERRFI